MNKIDEIREKINAINSYTNIILYLLEQLKPYVDCAELLINSEGAYIMNTQEERIKFAELIKQIQEQENDTNPNNHSR